MKEYFVDYRQFDKDEEVLFEDTFRFMADDSDHALEQADDALQSESLQYELLTVY